MSTQPTGYTKDELIRLAVDALPTRGEPCATCNAIIPEFVDLTGQERGRINHLILESRTLMAMHELRSITLCPMPWAKIWVEHAGHILNAQPGAGELSYRQRELWVYDEAFNGELLPREAAAYAEAEIIKRREFANAHCTSLGFNRTGYLREEALAELRTLRIKKERLHEIVSPFLRPFDVVYAYYLSPRERCRNTWAWGRSAKCALLAEWDDEGIIDKILAEFLEQDEASVLAATQAVAALGNLHPLVYVDWEWGYTCDVSEEGAFSSMLRTKLNTIADRIKSFMNS